MQILGHVPAVPPLAMPVSQVHSKDSSASDEDGNWKSSASWDNVVREPGDVSPGTDPGWG